MPNGYVAWINHKWDFGVIGDPGPPIRYIPFAGWEVESTIESSGWVAYEVSRVRDGYTATHVRAIPAVGPLPNNCGCPVCGAMIDEGVRVHRDSRSCLGALLPIRSKLYLEVYLTLECYRCSWRQPEQLVMLHDHGRPKSVWPWILRQLK